ncbi:MAG: asparaginase [Streptomyces sp.]|nr:asparaginase [Streptomyces sp.]NUS15327.1 asparaginase [Streptomyces sp.]
MTNAQPTMDASLVPPGSWRDPLLHRTAALDSLWYQMLTRLYGSLLEATNAFYSGTGITPVLMPLTVSSVSSPMGLGSDSLPVRIDLLGEEVYLADSMQFQLEFMLRHGLDGAYYVMPSFRGEEADETHLNQFFHSEAEIRGGLDEVMELVEKYLFSMTERLLGQPVGAEIEKVAGGLDHLRSFVGKSSLPRVTFAESVKLLGSDCFDTRGADIPVITRKGELALIERFGGAVWLTHPPHLSVPFYQRLDAQGRAECADLLLGVGEVVGCGARHLNGDEVVQALRLHEIEPAEYSWYVEMKETHPLATAGFGLGIERYVLWLLNHRDIRDLHVMPRIKGLPTCN